MGWVAGRCGVDGREAGLGTWLGWPGAGRALVRAGGVLVGWGEDAWAADGWPADGWAADGWPADGWPADGCDGAPGRPDDVLGCTLAAGRAPGCADGACQGAVAGADDAAAPWTDVRCGTCAGGCAGVPGRAGPAPGAFVGAGPRWPQADWAADGCAVNDWAVDGVTVDGRA